MVCAGKERGIVRELSKQVIGSNNVKLKSGGRVTLHATDWLMVVCHADTGNVIVAFISSNCLPFHFKKKNDIQGQIALLTMRVAVTFQH